MGKKLYVGNLTFSVTEDQLKDLFATYGTVESVKVITDRNTGRPKGFAFVEMSSDEEAQKAIDGLNSKDFEGRPMRVDIANPPSAGGGGRGGGGGYRGGGDRY